MKNTILFCALIFILACQKEKPEDFLGSALLDSPVIRISTEIPGRILWFKYAEGDEVKKGDTLALMDTSTLHLQILELRAQQEDFNQNLQARSAEIEPLAKQLQLLNQEKIRVQSLVAEMALPTQKLDEIQDQIILLKSKINTLSNTLRAQLSKNKVFETSQMRLADQKSRAWIIIPKSGQVQVKMVESGELAKFAQVLAEIQQMDTLEAYFYAPQALLPTLKMGQKVSVRTELPNGQFQMHEASIHKIASEAQFTPKGIQTRENRAELVFEVKIIIPNPQRELHPGLPVEVWR